MNNGSAQPPRFVTSEHPLGTANRYAPASGRPNTRHCTLADQFAFEFGKCWSRQRLLSSGAYACTQRQMQLASMNSGDSEYRT